MSAPHARNILKIPGKLVADPTDLSTDYPHGGTELGVCRDVVMNFGVFVDFPIAEEFKAPTAAILQEEKPVFACVLRSWDDSMLSKVWHNIQTSAYGEVGIKGTVAGSGIKRAGTNLASRAMKLFFSPHAVDQHRAILLYNVVPMPNESAELQMSIGREFGLALMFRCLPDALGRMYAVDLRANLTL